MTRANTILAGALIAQSAIAALVWRSSGEPVITPLHSLVSFDPAAVTAVEVVGRSTADKPATAVRLEKEGESWVIASSHRFPADAVKVTEALEKLKDVVVRDPISGRAVTHRDLEVADDTFTRKLTVTEGGQTKVLFLGAGKGQSANVRLPGSDDVFQSRGITAYTLPDADRRFWKAEYIDLKPDDLQTLTITNPNGTATLQRVEGAWTSSELPPGHTLVVAEVDSLARMLLTVRLGDVAGVEADPSMGLDGSTRVSWTTTVEGQSEAGGYTVGALADGKRYVKADDRPWVIRVTDSAIKRAVETKFEFIDDGVPDFVGQVGDPGL